MSSGPAIQRPTQDGSGGTWCGAAGRDQLVVDPSRKWRVGQPIVAEMAELLAAIAKLDAADAVRRDRHAGPGGDPAQNRLAGASRAVNAAGVAAPLSRPQGLRRPGPRGAGTIAGPGDRGPGRSRAGTARSGCRPRPSAGGSPRPWRSAAVPAASRPCRRGLRLGPWRPGARDRRDASASRCDPQLHRAGFAHPTGARSGAPNSSRASRRSGAARDRPRPAAPAPPRRAPARPGVRSSAHLRASVPTRGCRAGNAAVNRRRPVGRSALDTPTRSRYHCRSNQCLDNKLDDSRSTGRLATS
jgi:hypothetical protein